MNRIKQKAKIKEPVRLRAKSLSNGNKSLYLDTYYRGKRVYEFLKLYLIPERSGVDKATNAATMRAATAIKAKRILELVNGKAGIRNPDCRSSIEEWVEQIIKMKSGHRSNSSVMLMKRLSRHLQKYRPNVGLADIDREFCIGFADYLRSAHALNSSKLLMQATQFELLNALSGVLNEAVRSELIVSNPMRLLNSTERIKKSESKREYLTPDEVKSMIAVSSDHISAGDDVAAFLFCCFCGLRYSDITRLTWADITDTGSERKITMTMKKTHRSVEVPVSEIAASLLPAFATAEEKVFAFPRYGVTLKKLKETAREAGVKKKLLSTFRATLSPP